MRLADLVGKIKEKVWHSPDPPKDVFVFLLICLVGLGAFLLGRLSSMEISRKGELKIIQADPPRGIGEHAERTPDDSLAIAEETASHEVISPSGGSIHGMYVGSRNGTAYYLPWCGGVKLIHEENKVWFATKEEAEQKGYRPAANCKGI